GVYSLTRLPRPDVPDVLQPREVNREPPAVLRLQLPVNRTLKAAGFAEAVEMIAAFAGDREKLLAARQQHPRPARHENIVPSLNGLAIAALAENSRILGDPQLLGWAQKAGEHIWALAYNLNNGVLKHETYHGQVQTNGFLQDYASLGAAFMSLA